ncbi:histidinol-phosphate transaminase [Peterkaempfera sp. SMS 1(5)a]|uniref:histidinol-phosphate transaminase n=1 Tax=Peterkaempfera podocarpi TaxID=3232308 RepID=UPI00366DA915
MIAPRPWLSRIHPYRPGTHSATEDGSLASNESPLGASPEVVRAVAQAASRAHTYPDPLADELRTELAGLHEVSPAQILLGNGSDELIFLLAWAYLAHGGHAVCADPAYRMDEISSQVVNARVTKVPLRDWTHDLDAMADVAADIAYVVNPHNPTGTALPFEALDHFAATSRAGLVVVDEAYVDFADNPAATTAVPLAREGRVAVLRTFSKIHGLAGLRVGYLVADAEIVATLRTIRAPFSVGSLAQAAALAALRDPEHRQAVRQHTIEHRTLLTELITTAGYRVVPSQANFLLVQTPDEQRLVARLAAHGIAVRPGSTLGVPGTVRMSVPTARGLELLQRALA